MLTPDVQDTLQVSWLVESATVRCGDRAWTFPRQQLVQPLRVLFPIGSPAASSAVTSLTSSGITTPYLEHRFQVRSDCLRSSGAFLQALGSSSCACSSHGQALLLYLISVCGSAGCLQLLVCGICLLAWRRS